jgi:hypothetical protein
MAEVLTTKVVEPVIAPFTTVTSPLRDNTGVPWGQASHVGEFDVAAVGAGDTGKLIMRLRIPANYYCQLAGFHIDTRQTSEPKWDSGIFENYYTGQNSLSPGYPVQEIAFPLGVTSVASIGSNQYKNVGIADQSAASVSGYEINSPSNYLFKGYVGDVDICPTVEMYQTATTVHATRFRFAITWKMFDLDQRNHPWLITSK